MLNLIWVAKALQIEVGRYFSDFKPTLKDEILILFVDDCRISSRNLEYMILDRIKEFHNIMPIQNVPSVLEHGILCHEASTQLEHRDVSMATVQARREATTVAVPNGLLLHQYANLYFDARNPMMYKLIKNRSPDELCILIVSKEVIRIDGVVIADKNASSDYVRFLGPAQLNELNLDMIYADDWRHPDNRVLYLKHKSTKCAEVLIPRVVPPNYIQGAYVFSTIAKNSLNGLIDPVMINKNLFFDGRG